MLGKFRFPRGRLLLCALAAAACALAFVFAMAALPTSPLPLWLPALAAVCGGGLCAWVCFAGRDLRRQKTFRHWPARLAAMVCAALLCALALELFCFNHRAFLTRDCEPWELPLTAFTDEQGQPVADADGSIHFVISETGACVTLRLNDIGAQTQAVAVTLSGEASPVRVIVRLRDEASRYFYIPAAEGVCVPGARGLETFFAALYSNGLLEAVELELSAYLPATALDAAVALESVTLNPQVPVRWEPLRVALCAGALALLMGMLRFPWRGVRYQPGKRSHRRVIVLPMLLLMTLNIVLAVGCMPPDAAGDPFRGLFRGVSTEAAAQNRFDAYGMLFTAFRNGDLCVGYAPSQALTELENPYDRSQRIHAAVTEFFDYAMYEGRYYVYFGPAPVLLCYFPYYFLTGRVPSETLCGLMLALLSTPLIYLAVLGLVRKYAKRTNLFVLSLLCLTVACVAGWPWLMTAASRYENVVACNVAMMAGALGFGFHACLEKRKGRRFTLFFLCGCCFGLQAMSRANTLLITTAFLAPSFVGVLMNKTRASRQRAADALCFLAPALAAVGGVMAYNYLRFGSAAEFGQLYQITAEDIRYNVFRVEYAPQALWYFLLSMPVFSSVFPYVGARDAYVNVTGNFFWRMACVGILAYPLTWLLPFMKNAFSLYRDEPRARRVRRGFTLLAPLAVSLGLMVVTYFYAGVMQRYTHGFLLTFALVCAWIAATQCCDEAPAARDQCLLCVLVCFASVALAIGFGFSNERMLLEQNAPEWYYRLVRMFFPY